MIQTHLRHLGILTLFKSLLRCTCLSIPYALNVGHWSLIYGNFHLNMDVFFTIRPILSNYLSPVDRHTFHTPQKLKKIYERTAKRTGISCHTDTWDESKIKTPWIASLAIKAAELQGKRLGKIFLRKIQESLFLKKRKYHREICFNELCRNCWSRFRGIQKRFTFFTS